MKITNLVFALLSCFCLQATAQENIVDRLNKALGVRLPAEYEATVREFVNTNKVLKKQIAADFTEQYIIKEMKSSWGIDRQNKLLFVWCAIGYNYNQDFYTGDDGNKKRMDDFEAVLDSVEACQKRYKDQLIAEYERRANESERRANESERRANESERRANESERRIANAVNEIITELNESLNLLKEFYYSYKQSPNEEDLKEFKSDAEEVISLCKKYNVDYKKILSSEILRFYGVE